MTTAEFDLIVRERCERIVATLGSKGHEYARGNNDRLVNFKRAGASLGCTPERALIGMVVKHWGSIVALVDELTAETAVDEDIWNEKLGDVINYMILLEGLVKERNK